EQLEGSEAKRLATVHIGLGEPVVGRFAAILGPAMFGMVASTLGWGRPAAMGSLLLWILVAWWILRGVTDEERVWGPEDRLPEAA
ncbi:MAG: hypothetical protein O2956_15315, partial [Gemmatimonadetes bacterium]|nr:hypothetical protein [Gemmatimonadota bacterium]